MVRRVTEEWLQQVCGGPCKEVSAPKAYRIAVQMGPLAAWWLKEDVLQKARDHADRLYGQHEEIKRGFSCWTPAQRAPQESGSCWLLLINQLPEKLKLLRPAFVFPVRWAKNEEHHAHLPWGLRQLADQLMEQLRREKEIDQNSRWGLRPIGEHWLERHDLSSLDWKWDSAGAALGAGLLLAHWEVFRAPHPL